MKFKILFDNLLKEEESVLLTNDYKSLLTSQSYYILLTAYKVEVISKKDGAGIYRRHWLYDELIGDGIKHLIVQNNTKLTKQDIFNCFMSNFDVNYKRLLKDVLTAYKDFVTKQDLDYNKIKEFAEDYYNNLANWIFTNKNKFNRNNWKNLVSDFIGE